MDIGTFSAEFQRYAPQLDQQGRLYICVREDIGRNVIQAARLLDANTIVMPFNQEEDTKIQKVAIVDPELIIMMMGHGTRFIGMSQFFSEQFGHDSCSYIRDLESHEVRLAYEKLTAGLAQLTDYFTDEDDFRQEIRIPCNNEDELGEYIVIAQLLGLNCGVGDPDAGDYGDIVIDIDELNHVMHTMRPEDEQRYMQVTSGASRTGASSNISANYRPNTGASSSPAGSRT